MTQINPLLEEVQETEAAIEKGKHWRTSALANEKMYQENITRLETELAGYGINPATAKEDLAKLEEQMRTELSAIQSLVPYELIGLPRP